MGLCVLSSLTTSVPEIRHVACIKVVIVFNSV